MSLTANQSERLQKILDQTKQEKDRALAAKHHGAVPQPNTYEEDGPLGEYCTELY